MTKKKLAESIVETVTNSADAFEAIENVKSLLDVLEPKNLGQFAKWGYPEQQSTPKECWK